MDASTTDFISEGEEPAGRSFHDGVLAEEFERVHWAVQKLSQRFVQRFGPETGQ